MTVNTLPWETPKWKIPELCRDPATQEIFAVVQNCQLCGILEVLHNPQTLRDLARQHRRLATMLDDTADSMEADAAGH
jgi:hypothetical protein